MHTFPSGEGTHRPLWQSSASSQGHPNPPSSEQEPGPLSSLSPPGPLLASNSGSGNTGSLGELSSDSFRVRSETSSGVDSISSPPDSNVGVSVPQPVATKERNTTKKANRARYAVVFFICIK